MIRAFFFCQNIFHRLCSVFLHDFLQDGLAIIKELFVFNIIQDKIQHKLLCISKTTIQNPLRGTAPNLTIEENLALAYTRKASPSFFALNKKDSSYFREVLSTLGMGLEDRMKTKIGLLSGGQRQAASLLMATIAEPELLLLDEHTAALDPGAAEKVMALTKKIVEENKITTLMITHDMEYALEYGSRTIMLDSGKIVMDLTGKEREEMTTGKLAELFYGKAHKRG